MAAVARVSRKIPTPRPRPTEVREKAILVLLSRLITTLRTMPPTDTVDRHTQVAIASVRLSQRDRHHLVGAYGNSCEIKPVNPEIQLIERGFHRPQHAGRTRRRGVAPLHRCSELPGQAWSPRGALAPANLDQATAARPSHCRPDR